MLYSNDNGLRAFDLVKQTESTLSNQHATVIETNSFNEDILAIAGDSKICILDHRTRTTICDATVNNPVTGLDWNPLVPYWCTVQSSSSISIHDVRVSLEAPVREYKESFLKTFTWSNANCDLFLTSTMDQSVCLWGLGSDKCHSRVTFAKTGGTLTSSTYSPHKVTV